MKSRWIQVRWGGIGVLVDGKAGPCMVLVHSIVHGGGGGVCINKVFDVTPLVTFLSRICQ